MMYSTIALQRIVKARRAMMAAGNPKFKEYWQGVVNKLSEGFGG